MKVMIVEDDLITRKFIVKWFESKGHIPFAYSDAESALDAYKQWTVPLILTDWMLPGMDGLEFCQHIREVNSESERYTYIIMLTSKSGHRDLIQGLDAGADDFMSKPIQLDELSARIRVADRISGLHNQIRQLNTLLPTCSYCKKIRDEKEAWVPIEEYISERTGSDFSHGVCPDCYERVMTDYRKSADQAKS